LKDEWMIIDPLDGSSNHALGMSNYGYMAAYLLNGRINGSVIVLPEYDQYIVFQDQQVLYAQPLPSIEAYEYGTVYYAYPPKQDELTRTARCALLDLIDANSAGMYRYGSACVGLYQLLCGRHMAFIGHGIRVWDAIAFLPVLTSRQIAVMYATKGNELTLIASHRADFINAAAQILEEHQGLTLLSFLNNDLRHQAK
jgi:fructose-1,6-bisphosphatase/inositol monophosphatase family enzyme